MGWPLASISKPSATSLPSLRATRTLPIATRLVAMSSRMGGCWLVPGSAMQIGFVEKRPSLPRNGVTRPRWSATLTKCRPTRPAALAISPYAPTRPMWCAFASVMATTPIWRQRAMAASIAWPATGRPYPRTPSNISVGPSSFTTFARVFGTTSPIFRCRT